MGASTFAGSLESQSRGRYTRAQRFLKDTMKEKIINALINGVIGVLTSIATIYLGGSAAETVAASGLVTGVSGKHIADAAVSLFG